MSALCKHLVSPQKICTFAVQYKNPLGRLPINLTYLIMATVKSIGVGKGTGRTGNVYYRSTRGRTIMCDMPTVNQTSTRAPMAVARQTIFGLVNRYIKLHANSIAVSFNRTKYGSQRNYFVQVNYAAMKEALKELPKTASDTEIETAITTYATANPTSVYRVRLDGYTNVYLKAKWSAADDPKEAAPDGGGGSTGGDDNENPLG